MADSLDDGQFWLPPQFLTDEDDPHTSLTTKTLFPSPPAPFPLEFGALPSFSDFGSSGESLKSFSETESDEDDLIPGLTLRVTRSAIDDPDNAKGRVLAGSPQSTLFGMESGSGCSQGSSRGSPKSNSKVPSPPPTWDLLHAAAGEVAKMRINENRAIPAKISSSGTGFFQNVNSYTGFRQQQIPNKLRTNREIPSCSRLPPPQNAGKKALFPVIPAGKRESAGTGVFLPRHTGNQPEQRRKPGCSTVLIPARVMQALNLNIDDICRRQTDLQTVAAERFNSENDVLLRLQINRDANNNKRSGRRQPPTEHEIKLPQEWTY